MIVMSKVDPNSTKFIMDISTTRLFSIHAYITDGIGDIKISQSNFNISDRFEEKSVINLDSTNLEKKNAIVSIKDAPCKYFMIELDTVNADTVVELEIIYK